MQRNPNYGTLFEKWEIETARYWAERFSGLKGYDTDDLMQMCLVKWLEVIRDSKSRGKKFMTVVLRRFLLSLKQKTIRQKRRVAYESVSMDVVVGICDGKNELTLHEVVGYPDETFGNIPLSLDIHRVLQKLSPAQITLCQHLMAGKLTPEQIASVLKKDKSTIYRRIEKIRQLFAKEGLMDYLK